MGWAGGRLEISAQNLGVRSLHPGRFAGALRMVLRRLWVLTFPPPFRCLLVLDVPLLLVRRVVNV